MGYIHIKEVDTLYNSYDILQKRFLEIKRMGWIKTYRNGYTGIGYTFEKLLGKDEDSLCIPDFHGIEIKTHRATSNSYITLFNYNPIGESSYELKRIFSKYSYLHTKNKNIRALNANIYCNYINDVGVNYKFSLDVDENEKKIFLLIFDRLGKLIERKSYWTFDTIKEKLYKKLRYLAFVEADSMFINGCEFFKYNKLMCYSLKDFSSFIHLIKVSKIRVSFLISGCFDQNECINTHGTSFSIRKENLNLLFNPINLNI